MRTLGGCVQAGSACGCGPLARCVLLALLALALLMPGSGPAAAVQAITVKPDLERIEVTGLGEVYSGRGDTLHVETAPGADGVGGRMSVRATTPGTNPGWIVFALHNPSDKAVERWLTAERYAVIGSAVIWPDLDARRIETVTPSLGFLPDRVKSDRADIFRITLEPGQTITYVAELSSERLARVYLWKPLEYELKARDRQLFNGIMLGITGLLALFLTAVFAANHKAIFPAAALVAWCVLGYLCVDFGFWHKLFQLRPEDNAIYRAATESAIAASLVIFLGVFLRLRLSHGFVRMLMGVWITAQLALVAVAIIDPRLAATIARASFVAIGGFGALLTTYLAVRGQDRALSLVPTWLLLLVWIFAAGVTLTGRLSGDIIVSGLVAGLVLIIVLMGFTVTQFAFRSFEPIYGAAPTELQVRSAAIDGAGAAVWEWLARRDEIKVSPIIEAALGLVAGELSAKVDDFAKHLHPADRERFRLLLWSVQERNGGTIRTDLRLRHADNSYRWYDLEATSVPQADRKALRCVGLMRDVTETKRSQERLMHDAVHDSLTGLPNRELLLDRLGVAVARSRTEPQVRPTVLFIDIDKFKSVNASFGLVVGDSLLLTVARRLTRHLGPQDTLARVAGDQFAILLIAHQDARELAMLAERVRRSLRSPIKIAGNEVVLTASTGIATLDDVNASAHDLLKEAEVAMYRAKRGGADRVEIFRPEMRSQPDDRIAIESDLRRALERKQITILYQPIVYLPTEDLAGFEALVRWEHPKLGMISPSEFVPVAEESDLISKLGSHVLTRAAQEAARWHKELPRVENPLFVSVNVSSRQLFQQDFIQEVRHLLGRAIVPPGALRLELTESLVMENPEQAAQILEWLRSAGAALSLDDFGTGYSSLAYLQRFAFDTIKIDRDLVQSCGSEGPGSIIVRSILALAHELGRKVVAEGVEEEVDANFLRALGCEFAQGYYYGDPMPEREVLQMLRSLRKSERRLHRRGFFRVAGAVRKRRGQDSPAAAQPATPDLPAVAAREPEAGARSLESPAPASKPPAAPPRETGKVDAAGRTAQRPKRSFGQLLAKEAARAGVSSPSEAPRTPPSAAAGPPPLQHRPLPVAAPSLTPHPQAAQQMSAGKPAPPQPAPSRDAAGNGQARPPRRSDPPARAPVSPSPTRSQPAFGLPASGAPAGGSRAHSSKAAAPSRRPAPASPQRAAEPNVPRTGPPLPAGQAQPQRTAPPALPASPGMVNTAPPAAPAAPAAAAARPAAPTVSVPAASPFTLPPLPAVAKKSPPADAGASPRTEPAVPAPGSAAGQPQYPSLPPAIAESLSRLAGVPITELATAKPAGPPANAGVSAEVLQAPQSNQKPLQR